MDQLRLINRAGSFSGARRGGWARGGLRDRQQQAGRQPGASRDTAGARPGALEQCQEETFWARSLEIFLFRGRRGGQHAEMAFLELGKKLRQQFGLNPHFLGLSPRCCSPCPLSRRVSPSPPVPGEGDPGGLAVPCPGVPAVPRAWSQPGFSSLGRFPAEMGGEQILAVPGPQGESVAPGGPTVRWGGGRGVPRPDPAQLRPNLHPRR